MGWKCYRESNDGHIVSIACLWLETYQTDNWESISCLCNSITGFKGRLKYGPSQFIIPYLMIDRVLSPSKRRLISAWICMLSVVCPPTSSASCLTLKHSFMVEIAWLAFGNPVWHQFRLLLTGMVEHFHWSSGGQYILAFFSSDPSVFIMVAIYLWSCCKEQHWPYILPMSRSGTRVKCEGKGEDWCFSVQKIPHSRVYVSVLLFASHNCQSSKVYWWGYLMVYIPLLLKCIYR